MELQFKIINTLIRHGYLLQSHSNEDQYYFRNDRITIEYITPHEGTNNKHMLRAELIEDFHKYDDAQFEEFIEGDIDIIKAVVEFDNMKSVKKD